MIGGTLLNASGTAAAGVSWNKQLTMNVNATQTIQLVTMAAAASAVSAPPLAGEILVGAVHGCISFVGASASGSFTLGVGIYLSKYNSNTTQWNIQDPLNSADAARDDWEYLRAGVYDLASTATITSPGMIEFALSLRRPIVVGGGEALNCTINQASITGSTATLSAVAFIRSAVRQLT